jgi:hypothetical protein
MKNFFLVTLSLFVAVAALAGIQPFSKPTPAVFQVNIIALLDTNTVMPFTGVNFYYSTFSSTNPIFISTEPATNGMTSVPCSVVINQFWSEQRFYYGAVTNANTGFESDYFYLTNLPPHFVLRMK